MKSGRFCAIVLLLTAVVVFSPKARADTDCSTTTAGSGEAIQCRMGNLLSKNADVITKLKGHFASCDATDPKCAAAQNGTGNQIRHIREETKNHNEPFAK
jgi:hypothetical protein